MTLNMHIASERETGRIFALGNQSSKFSLESHGRYDQIQCSFYRADEEFCMLVVLPRQFSFHILTIKTPMTSDPNVYPGPIIVTSLLIKKTRLGFDCAQLLGVHVRNGVSVRLWC